MVKGALISMGSTSSQWIAKAMKKYFDEVDFIDIREIEIFANKKDVGVFYGGKILKDYDCIYARGSFRYANVLQAISEVLYDKAYMPIQPQSFVTVHDKFFTQIELAKHRILTPPSYLVATGEAAKKILKDINYPIIIKFPTGTHGKGVMYAESYASASSMLDAVESRQSPLIIQTYFETKGEDIRAIVAGDKVIACMLRRAGEREKRANIHSGGKGIMYDVDDNLKSICIKSAKVLGAEICAIDLLETSLGYFVIEANLSVGIQGITSATDINIADKIAEYLYKKTKKFKDEKKKVTAGKIMENMGKQDKIKHFVSNVDLRGNRILLPDMVTKISQLDHGHEIIIKADKGKITMERIDEEEE